MRDPLDSVLILTLPMASCQVLSSLKIHHGIISICGDSKFREEAMILSHTGGGEYLLRIGATLYLGFCLSDTNRGDTRKCQMVKQKPPAHPFRLLSHRFSLFQEYQYTT